MLDNAGGQAARDAVQSCRAALTGFEAVALAADTGSAATEIPELRIVD